MLNKHYRHMIINARNIPVVDTQSQLLSRLLPEYYAGERDFRMT